MQTEAIHKDVLVHRAPSHSPLLSSPLASPSLPFSSPPTPLPLTPLLLSLTGQSPERQTNEYFLRVLSFISASNLFINVHKAVAGTYHWQWPLSCLSDETEVAEFTKRSYGRMDVTGSGGRSHILLHNIHKPVHQHVGVCKHGKS